MRGSRDFRLPIDSMAAIRQSSSRSIVMILARVVASSGSPTLPSARQASTRMIALSVSVISRRMASRARRSPRFPRLRVMTARIAIGSRPSSSLAIMIFTASSFWTWSS